MAMPGRIAIRRLWGGSATRQSAVDDPLQEGTVSTAFSHLSYKLYLPRRLAPKPAIIVMLHGCTQTAQDFATGTDMNRLADRHGFIVIYPQQNLSANMNRCWNWFDRRNQDQSGEPAAIMRMVDDVAEAHDIPPDTVFVAGLSAGGALAAIMGRAYADRIAGIGIHAGVPAGAAQTVQGAFRAMENGDEGEIGPGPTPAIIFQGDADSTVAPANGDRIAFAPGAPVRRRRLLSGWRWCHRYLIAPVDEHAQAEYWLVRGLGHAWSGGRSLGSYTDPRGPRASHEMVRFFMGYSRMAYPWIVIRLFLTRPFR